MAGEVISPEQMDFAGVLFPGRKMLYVCEVAERLEMGEQSVRDLIEEGKLHAIDVGGGGERKFWRIPVTAFERFLKERSSLKETENGKAQASLSTPNASASSAARGDGVKTVISSR